MKRALKSAARVFKKNIKAADRRVKRRGGLIYTPRSMEDLLRSVLSILKDIKDSL
jgi:hypothetical protein